MIEYAQALLLVEGFLNDSEIPLQVCWQGEFSEGWYFCFQSKEYLETGVFSARLVGNGPIVVDRNSGDMYFFGSDKPLHQHLEEYKKARKSD